jgi:predicted DNA-binding transcriptional regulator AlpA
MPCTCPRKIQLTPALSRDAISRHLHPRRASGHCERRFRMSEPTVSEFLTKRELAQLCRCSERTLDRLLEQGDAPPVTRVSSRRIIFPLASAREWLSNRTAEKRSTQGEGTTGAATEAATERRRRRRPRKNHPAVTAP